MEQSIFFNFRNFYGQTQLQNFEQKKSEKVWADETPYLASWLMMISKLS